jgi:thiamine biosynthesis lipoprotein
MFKALKIQNLQFLYSLCNLIDQLISIYIGIIYWKISNTFLNLRFLNKIMYKILATILTIFILSSCVIPKKTETNWKAFKIEGFAQGTSYQITYYSKNQVVSSKYVNQLFNELDSSLSIYKPYSLINKFNNSEKGLLMDKHLLKVVKRSMKIWKESEGVFDISILPLVDVWGFGPTKHSKQPNDSEITHALSCSGSDKLLIKGRMLVKTKPCLKIDVNGIAQGYSVDYIAEYLDNKGVKNYLVEIGGEIRVRGRKQPGNERMRIGIEQPSSIDSIELQKTLQLRSGAITSSGNYRRFIQSGSKKISHLMDIKTGYPLDNEIISVTVRAKNTMSADGYDNALIGMGIKKAFEFLKKHKKIDAYFIYKDENGLLRDTATQKFFR